MEEWKVKISNIQIAKLKVAAPGKLCTFQIDYLVFVISSPKPCCSEIQENSLTNYYSFCLKLGTRAEFLFKQIEGHLLMMK